MKKKITTKRDLVNSVKKIIKENYESDINELGSEDYHMMGGELRVGKEPAPSPSEMAEKVIASMKLHPDFYSDSELMKEFIEILHEMLTEKLEYDDIPAKDYDQIMTNPMMDKSRMNEGVSEMKRIFDKFRK